MSVPSFCLFLFSCEHFPGCSDFSQKKGSGSQNLPMSPVAGAVGGVTVCVPPLGNFAPCLCSPLGTWCWVVSGWCCAAPAAGSLSLVLCVHRSRCQPVLPACGTPVAPAGASVQGSAGAHSKPLLKTSAVTLIVDLPFLILSMRQQSAWRFVLSCLNLVNIVSKKLTKVTIL